MRYYEKKNNMQENCQESNFIYNCKSHHEISTMTKNQRTLPAFPTEIIFKAVFRNFPFVRENILQTCAESGIDATITERASKNGTFISYTITATFPNENTLRIVCTRIGELEGFMTMF